MSVSVDNLAEKAFDNFKKVTPALTAIAMMTGMLLFLPQSILAKMKLDEMPVLWNQIVGMIFLLSIALIITIVLFSIIAKIKEKQKRKRFRENLRRNLKNLSADQKNIICKLLSSKNKTIVLDKNSGDTVYLVNNSFIHGPDQVVTPGWNHEIMMRYVPQPWLMDLYNEEPELFK